MKQPAILDTVRDLKDRSAKLSFVTRELNNEEFAKLRDMRGQEGWLLFALSEVSYEDVPEGDPDLEVKSKAKQLSDVLYVLCRQEGKKKPTEEEWHRYYHNSMDKIIQVFKNKLE